MLVANYQGRSSSWIQTTVFVFRSMYSAGAKGEVERVISFLTLLLIEECVVDVGRPGARAHKPRFKGGEGFLWLMRISYVTKKLGNFG